MRATAPPQRPAPERPRSAPWRGALAFAAAAGLTVLGAYLVHPIASGFRLPVGPDGPVYVWWTRYVDALGLSELPGGRVGVPAIALALRPYLGTGALETVTLLGPVLASAAGLAAAALVEVTLGPNLIRGAAAAILTGAFASYLAGGWLGNTALVAVFLVAAAALATVHRSWRGVAGASLLLAAAVLTHRFVSLLLLAIVVGVVIAYLPEHVRERRAGSRPVDTTAGRISIATLSAGALALAALLPSLGLARLPGDTSQDGFFRRLGLRDLLRDRFRERLGGDAARAAVPIAIGAALGTLGIRRAARDGEGGFLLRLLGSWALVTVVAVTVFAITGWGPPHRVVVFSFFLPLAAAVGVETAWVAGRGRRIAAVAIALGFAAVAMLGWVRQSPAFAAADLAVARAAGHAVADLPPGTPLVFAFDTDEPAAAYHVTAALNVIRMGLPPERIPDAYIGVGTSGDVALGRTRTNGDAEHDAIARAYLAEIRAATTDRAWYVIVPTAGSPLDLDRVSPGAADVGFIHVSRAEPGPEDRGLSAPALVGFSVAALVLLAALGGGWSRWILPGAGPRAVACAAAATGAGLLVLGAVAADLAGLDPAGWSGLAATAAIGLGGYLAAFAAGRR